MSIQDIKHLFDTNRIEQDKTKRGISLGFSWIPLTIFMAGASLKTSKQAGAIVRGRPASWMFGLSWAILVIFMVFIWILVAFRYDYGYVVAIQSTIAFFVLFAILWLFYYNKKRDKVTAYQMLSYSSVFPLSALVLTILGTSDLKEANVFTSLLLVPLITWVAFAGNLNFMEINK